MPKSRKRLSPEDSEYDEGTWLWVSANDCGYKFEFEFE